MELKFSASAAEYYCLTKNISDKLLNWPWKIQKWGTNPWLLQRVPLSVALIWKNLWSQPWLIVPLFVTLVQSFLNVVFSTACYETWYFKNFDLAFPDSFLKSALFKIATETDNGNFPFYIFVLRSFLVLEFSSIPSLSSKVFQPFSTYFAA